MAKHREEIGLGRRSGIGHEPNDRWPMANYREEIGFGPIGYWP
jgi:hypothetical protein